MIHKYLDIMLIILMVIYFNSSFAITSDLGDELHLAQSFAIDAQWVVLAIRPTNQMMFIISDPLATYGITENGDTLWTQPGISVFNFHSDLLITNYILTRGSRVKKQNMRELFLVNIDNGKILDRIEIPLGKGEELAEIIWAKPFYFVHLLKHGKGLYKKYFIYRIVNNKLKMEGIFKTSLWLLKQYYDDENDWLLVANLSNMNGAFPYQGDDDCTGGIYLISTRNWQIINRLLPSGNGFINSSFYLKDSLLYIIFYSNIHNEIPFLELVVAHYPTLKIYKRKQFPFINSLDKVFLLQDGEMFYLLYNGKENMFYKLNSNLEIVQKYHFNLDSGKYPMIFQRYKIFQTLYFNIYYDKNKEPQIFVLQKKEKKPIDPKGQWRDRRGRISKFVTFYHLDANFNEISKTVFGHFADSFHYRFIPELKKFLYITKNQIMVYELK